MPKLMTYASYYAPLAPGTIVVSEPIYSGLNLAEKLGFPTEPVEVFLTILPNIVVQSNDPNKAAVSTLGLPAGSTLQINNFGYIIGAGGAGGTRFDLVPPSIIPAEDGQPGGDAIYSNIPIAIASAFGFIWGGGGGAGGLYAQPRGVPALFTGGNGGAGRGPLGGGEAGIGDIMGKTAVAFEIGVENGRGGRGYYPSEGNAGDDHAGETSGNYYGDGGNYGADGMGSFYGIAGFTSNGDTGQTYGYLTNTFAAFGGKGGYSVNVSEIGHLQWLDTGYTNTQHVKGKYGVRPGDEMPLGARQNLPINILVMSDREDLNLFNEVGLGSDVSVDVFVYVAPGVLVTSSSAQTAALSTLGLHPNSRLYLYNRGRIIGRGGRGGSDPAFFPPDTLNPTHGEHGGDGVRSHIPIVMFLPAAADNAVIAGGGGGGGLCRILPLEVESFGGMGGMGGGAGGQGTLGIGSSMPLIDEAELLRTKNNQNYVLAYTAPQDHREYLEGTSWFNEAGKGGTYGCSGQPGRSSNYHFSQKYYELSPGGREGWAINSSRFIRMIAATSGLNINLSSASAMRYFLRGRTSHDGVSSTLSAKPPTFSVTPTKHWDVFNLVQGVMSFNLMEALGNPTTAVRAIIHIRVGVSIQSSHASLAAINTGRLPPGSEVDIFNEGSIFGCGGDGGGLDGHDPNEIPNLTGTTDSHIGNGKPGGIGLILYSPASLRQCTSVFYSQVRTTIRSFIIGGGGGGPGIFTADFYGADHTPKYFFIADSVRFAHGGPGGAGGGRGGVGLHSTGQDGGRDIFYTPDGRMNDQRGVGRTMQKTIAGTKDTVDVIIGMGGFMGAAGLHSGFGSGGINHYQFLDAQGNYMGTRILGTVSFGMAGSGGAHLVVRQSS